MYVQFHSLAAAVVGVAVLTLAGCSEGGGENEVAFEVRADTSTPTIERTGPAGSSPQPRVMPGAEVFVAGMARHPQEAQALWDQAGFQGSLPSFADDRALLVLAGGQSTACPWTVDSVEADSTRVSVSLAAPAGAEDTDCTAAAWQPHAVALALPAAALPTGDDVRQDPTILVTSDTLPASLLPAETLPLAADGLPWSAADTAFPYRLSRGGASAEHLTEDRPVAVTSFPNFDVVHVRFETKHRGGLSADYTTHPSVPVKGDAFVRLELGPVSTSTQRMPRSVDAPASAALTELVRLPDAPTWIVGLDGDKAPLTLWSSTHDLPAFTGSTHLLLIPHADSCSGSGSSAGDHHGLLAEQRAVVFAELPPALDDFLFEGGLGLLGCGVHESPHGRQVDVLPQEVRGGRQVQRGRRARCLHVFEAGVAQQLAYLVRVMHGEHQADEPAEVGADVADEGLVHDFEGPLDRAGRVEDNAPAGGEDPPHFPEGRLLVLEERQAHLAQHDIEGAVGQRKGGRVGLAPLDLGSRRRRRRAGHFEHIGGHIRGHHRALGSDLFRGEAGDHTGATRHVEYPLARLETRLPEKVVGDRRGDRGDEVTLVVLGSRTAVLSVRDLLSHPLLLSRRPHCHGASK